MKTARRKVVLLGATGSIGDNTLQVLRRHPERLELVGVAAHRNRDKLNAIVEEFQVPHSSLFVDEGASGLERLATLEEADILLLATTGTIGIRPALAALKSGKDIALASKEVLVAAGRFVMEAAQASGRQVLPVDSEHSAIFQCLEGNRPSQSIQRLILTASGGPFREYSQEQLNAVTLEQALKHPNWDMGPKITIDSATMANKGLEMIEARWLFGVQPGQIDVVVHPQSIVHSMVEFVDGSILAQLSPPSMTFAIQHALLYPERVAGVGQSLDFSQLLSLNFEPPDAGRFPCLRLAREAMEAGGLAPAAYNTANEVAVAAFVDHRLPFTVIPKVIGRVLDDLNNFEPGSVEELITTESEIRTKAQSLLQQYGNA